MSVNNGDIANAQTFNNAFVSKKVDSTVDAKINLNDTGSAPVPDVQGKINTMDADITQNQADIAQNQTDIATNQTNISNNQTEIQNIRTTTGTAVGDTDMGTYTGTIISDNGSVKQNIQELETQVETNKNDIATLQNQPVFTFLGSWDASTNTPTLVDGTGSTGDAYKVSVAGTHDFGSGPVSFIVGDLVFYDGAKWDKDKEQVSSVFGRQGAVVAQAGDYTWAQIDKTVSSVGDISDVDTTTTPPVSGDKLKWDGSNWVPGKDSIDDLSDVDTTTTPPNLGEGLKWDGTNWVPGKVASSGGAGGKNYVKNTEIANLQDISATANITLALETTDPIRGLESLKATIDPAATTADYFEFALDAIDRFDYENSRDAWISFEYYTDANYTSGDLKVVLWDVTNAQAITVFEENVGAIQARSQKVKFTGRAQFDSTSSQYTLRFQVVNAPTTASNIVIDSPSVGPTSFVPGVSAGSKIRYTSTLSQTITSGTVTKINFPTMQYDDDGLVSTPGTDWKFIAPRDNHYLIDTILLINPVTFGVNKEIDSELVVNGSSRIKLGSVFTQATNTYYIPLTGSASVYLNKGDVVEIKVYQNSGQTLTLYSASGVFNSVSITELSRSVGSVSTTETMFETSYLNVTFPANFITFPSAGAIQKIPIDTIVSNSGQALELRSSTNDILVKETGIYEIKSQLRLSLPNVAGSRYSYIRVNGNSVNIYTLSKLANGSAENYTTNSSEIILLNKGDVVTFEFFNQDINDQIYGGVYSSFTIKKIPDLSVYSVWGETEVIKSYPANQFYSSAAANTWYNLPSSYNITLSPGEWMVTANIKFSRIGSTQAGTPDLYITFKDINGEPDINGDNYVRQNILPVSVSGYFTKNFIFNRHIVTSAQKTLGFSFKFSPTGTDNFQFETSSIVAIRLK